MSDTVEPPQDLSRFVPELPAAVRRQAERANQLIRESGADPDQPVTTVVNEPPAEPPAEPGPIETPPLGQVPSPTPPPTVTTVVETPPAEPAADTGNWEQRYRSLQGRFDSEVRQRQDMQRRVEQMQGLIATMQAAPPPAPPAPARVELPEVVIPQEDIDEYGQPMIDATGRWGYARVRPHLTAHEQRIAALEARFGQVQEITAKTGVEAALDREMPDWRNVNGNPEFHAWLQQIDWLSGNKRYDMIDHAYRSGDARRTAAFFRAFQDEQTTVTPDPGTVTGLPAEPAATIPLASLATPGRGPQGSQAAGGAPTTRTWTRAQVKQFYDRATRGIYRGREAEYNRIEADIFAAQAEGRIVG